MSTDRTRDRRSDRHGRETSHGGVVVRGEELCVIVPRGKRTTLALPKGGPNDGETGDTLPSGRAAAGSTASG